MGDRGGGAGLRVRDIAVLEDVERAPLPQRVREPRRASGDRLRRNHLPGRVRDIVQNRISNSVSIAQENPLGLALGALAVGVLAGLIVPVSELERRTVG